MNTLSNIKSIMVLFLMLVASAATQAQFYNLSTDIFEKDIAKDIEYDPTDAGHVTTGYTTPGAAGAVTLTNLVKYDFTGAAVWAHTYDWGTGLSRGNSVEKTIDMGYIIAGHAISPATGLPSAMLIKTDPFGSVIWSQFYDFSSPYSEAFDVVEVISPMFGVTYLVTGTFKNPGSGTLDIFALLTDAGGTIIFDSEFDTGFDEEGLSIKPGPGFMGLAGPAYVLSGYTTLGLPGRNVFVCGLDMFLGMVWGEHYGGPGDEEGREIEVSPIGELLVGGYSTSFSNGRRDVFISQLTPMGAPIWQNIYGLKRDEEGFSIEYISDGTIAACGWTNQLSATGIKDAFLMKLNFAGGLLFSKAYGGPNDDIGYAIKESISVAGIGGHLLMGGVYGEIPAAVTDDRDIYTVRTNGAGNAPCWKNPKFRQLPVVALFNNCLLPAANIAFNVPILPVDPVVPFSQANRCCTCTDMVVSFTYSPTIFCSGTPVTFTNTSTCVDNFRWLVNGVLVTSTVNMTYIFAAPGVYTVTLIGSNAGCPAISFATTIVVSCGPTPRLEDEGQVSSLQLLPNPATDRVALKAELGKGSDQSAFVRIADMTGRVVFANSYNVSGSLLTTELQTTDWTEGIYLVQVFSGSYEQTQRLLIAR